MRSAYTLVEFLTTLAIIAVLTALTLAGVQKVRAAAARAVCLNNLRQLAVAGQSYHAAHAHFPCGTSGDDRSSPMPFLNWHARLLPHLEQAALWAETEAAYKQDRDFLHNPPHTAQTHPMPVFSCPADDRLRDPVKYSVSRVHSLTSFMGVNGTRATKNDGVLYLDSKVRTADITDGTSNTLFIGERPPGGKNLSLGW
jgi:prepilin-type N-terminal cleavage/methylation domain-containing protein